MSKLSNIYYPTGELRGIYNKTNGLKDGLSYEYDKDQDVYIIRNFRKGKFHGESITYYPNGVIKSYCIFIDGNLSGYYKTYYKNGNIKEIKNYREGLKEGESRSYYITGNLERVNYYVNDKKHGEDISYYEDGTIKSIINFIDDNADFIVSYSQNKLVTHKIKF